MPAVRAVQGAYEGVEMDTVHIWYSVSNWLFAGKFTNEYEQFASVR